MGTRGIILQATRRSLSPPVLIAKDGEVGLRLMLDSHVGNRPITTRSSVGGCRFWPISARKRLGTWGFLALLAIAGCSSGPNGFRLKPTTAASFLKQAKDERDPNLRYEAYNSLGSPKCYDNDAQKAEAAAFLVTKLHGNTEPTATRAVICRTLGSLRRPEAREAILAATNDEDPLVRSEACRALGRVGQSEDATILARVMTLDIAGECRVAAIESLGELKSKDRRITEYLVSGMQHDDPAIRVASLGALREITGKDLGVDAAAWKQYVETLPTDHPTAPGGDGAVARASTRSTPR